MRHFIRQTFFSILESDIEREVWLQLSNAGCYRFWFDKLAIARYLSDVKDDKQTTETLIVVMLDFFHLFVKEDCPD